MDDAEAHSHLYTPRFALSHTKIRTITHRFDYRNPFYTYVSVPYGFDKNRKHDSNTYKHIRALPLVLALRAAHERNRPMADTQAAICAYGARGHWGRCPQRHCKRNKTDRGSLAPLPAPAPLGQISLSVLPPALATWQGFKRSLNPPFN